MNKDTENKSMVLTVRTLRELATMYGVSVPTLKKWLKPHDEKIGVKVGWYYSVNQVKIIFESLGLPNRTIENNSVIVD